ncbi:hypothetical protein DVR09_16815 (plasmid) [Erythrobacter aureus]|uniref:Uncharacterized protein n=2 Tax=Erythrobacter aureus TaxID=2182384 RepID=A0A345YJL2_9SPHN|nr:hypothetical protein DVR09_16815 [Erythrobacter aureus]
MVSKGARITDAILAVVFLGLAVFWGGWFWWASSAFCAATAIIGPIDHMYAWVRDRFLQVKQGK